ncbi:unnamed protein product, partial [Laminaria digitata]
GIGACEHAQHLAWFLLTSACLSKGAQGEVKHDPATGLASGVTCKNVELGVLFHSSPRRAYYADPPPLDCACSSCCSCCGGCCDLAASRSDPGLCSCNCCLKAPRSGPGWRATRHLSAAAPPLSSSEVVTAAAAAAAAVAEVTPIRKSEEGRR